MFAFFIFAISFAQLSDLSPIEENAQLRKTNKVLLNALESLTEGMEARVGDAAYCDSVAVALCEKMARYKTDCPTKCGVVKSTCSEISGCSACVGEMVTVNKKYKRKCDWDTASSTCGGIADPENTKWRDLSIRSLNDCPAKVDCQAEPTSCDNSVLVESGEGTLAGGECAYPRTRTDCQFAPLCDAKAGKCLKIPDDLCESQMTWVNPNGQKDDSSYRTTIQHGCYQNCFAAGKMKWGTPCKATYKVPASDEYETIVGYCGMAASCSTQAPIGECVSNHEASEETEDLAAYCPN